MTVGTAGALESTAPVLPRAARRAGPRSRPPRRGWWGRDKETRLPERQPGLPSQDVFERVLQPFGAPAGRSPVFNARIKLKTNFYRSDACTQLMSSRSTNLRRKLANPSPLLPSPSPAPGSCHVPALLVFSRKRLPKYAHAARCFLSLRGTRCGRRGCPLVPPQLAHEPPCSHPASGWGCVTAQRLVGLCPHVGPTPALPVPSSGSAFCFLWGSGQVA